MYVAEKKGYELYLNLHVITISEFKSTQTENTQIFNLRIAAPDWMKNK